MSLAYTFCPTHKIFTIFTLKNETGSSFVRQVTQRTKLNVDRDSVSVSNAWSYLQGTISRQCRFSDDLWWRTLDFIPYGLKITIVTSSIYSGPSDSVRQSPRLFLHHLSFEISCRPTAYVMTNKRGCLRSLLCKFMYT